MAQVAGRVTKIAESVNKAAADRAAAATPARPDPVVAALVKPKKMRDPNKPKKTPLERSFTAVAQAQRSIDRLARISRNWSAPPATFGASAEAISDTVFDIKTDVAETLTRLTDLAEGIATLAKTGFSPKSGGGAPRAQIAIGSHVFVRPLIREKKFDFLTEEQLAHLVVEREDGKRGYLISCRVPGAFPYAVGYLKAGALQVAGVVETPSDDE